MTPDLERLFDSATDYNPDTEPAYCLYGTCADSPAEAQPYCDLHAARRTEMQR